MNKYFKEIENVNEGKFLSLPVEVVPSFMFFSFRFIINSIILIMELKHLINEELYTNSLLISPNPD